MEENQDRTSLVTESYRSGIYFQKKSKMLPPWTASNLGWTNIWVKNKDLEHWIQKARSSMNSVVLLPLAVVPLTKNTGCQICATITYIQNVQHSYLHNVHNGKVEPEHRNKILALNELEWRNRTTMMIEMTHKHRERKAYSQGRFLAEFLPWQKMPNTAGASLSYTTEH